MAWFRYHYHCEACDGSWLAEGEAELVADCKFCAARDVFPYKRDSGRIGRANLRTPLAVVDGAKNTKTKAKAPARAGKLKRSA